MLDSASPSSPPLEDWMGRILDLLGDLDLEESARSTKALLRRRGVRSVHALLHLALARGPGGLSLRQTAAWAHLAGVADITDASLNDRLHHSCDFLSAIVEAMLRGRTNSRRPDGLAAACASRTAAASASPAENSAPRRIGASMPSTIWASAASAISKSPMGAAVRPSIAARRPKEKSASPTAASPTPRRCAATSRQANARTGPRPTSSCACAGTPANSPISTANPSI